MDSNIRTGSIPVTSTKRMGRPFAFFVVLWARGARPYKQMIINWAHSAYPYGCGLAMLAPTKDGLAVLTPTEKMGL